MTNYLEALFMEEPGLFRESGSKLQQESLRAAVSKALDRAGLIRVWLSSYSADLHGRLQSQFATKQRRWPPEAVLPGAAASPLSPDRAVEWQVACACLQKRSQPAGRSPEGKGLDSRTTDRLAL